MSHVRVLPLDNDNRAIRMVIVLFIAMLLTPLLVTATPPQPAHAAGCVTYTEYRTVPTNLTKTPLWVQAHFGATGRIYKVRTIQIGNNTDIWTYMDYVYCRTHTRRVVVRYHGWTHGRRWAPATADAKWLR